jgi:hypothetical protein
LNHVKDVEHERFLSEVCVDDLPRRLQSDGRVELRREVAEGNPKVMAILRVETCVVDEVHAASYDVVGGEGWTVGLSVAGRTKGIPIVTVIAVRLLVPALNEEVFTTQ